MDSKFSPLTARGKFFAIFCGGEELCQSTLCANDDIEVRRGKPFRAKLRQVIWRIATAAAGLSCK